MPYASLYEIADALETKFGNYFDLNSLVLWLRETYPENEMKYSEALVVAEANWRVDTLVMDNPEAMEKAAEVVESPSLEVVKKDPPGTMSLPPLPCGFRGVDGNECPRDSVIGAARCIAHGGMILDPEVRRSLMISAHAKMHANIEFGIETLLDVMDNSRNDIARVQAVNSLLDRAGMTPDQHVVLTDTNNVLDNDAKSREVINLLQSKLNATRDRLRLTSIPVDEVEDTG